MQPRIVLDTNVFLSQPCWGRVVPVTRCYEIVYGVAISRSWNDVIPGV
jgi:hypothetical protein